MFWGAMPIVKFLWHAMWRWSGWCNVIWLSRGLSVWKCFQHENSGQRNRVFTDIVDDMRGMEYTLFKGTKIGAGSDQPGVGVSSRYFQLTREIYCASATSPRGCLHPRSCKNISCAMSHNTMNNIKPLPNPWIKSTLSDPKTLRRVQYTMPETNQLEQQKWTRQEPNPNPNAMTIAPCSMQELVHSFPREPSRHTSGRKTLGRGASAHGTLGRGTLRKLLPRVYSRSSCSFTSTSEVVQAASAYPEIGTAGRGSCIVTSPKISSPLRGCISRVRGHGRCSRVCGCGACTKGCGRHQQNVKSFRSHNLTTHLFWTARLILAEAGRSFQTSWMQNDVLLQCSEKYVLVLLNTSEEAQQNTRIH